MDENIMILILVSITQHLYIKLNINITGLVYDINTIYNYILTLQTQRSIVLNTWKVLASNGHILDIILA